MKNEMKYNKMRIHSKIKKSDTLKTLYIIGFYKLQPDEILIIWNDSVYLYLPGYSAFYGGAWDLDKRSFRGLNKKLLMPRRIL